MISRYEKISLYFASSYDVFASCDGPYFKVTIEPVVEEQCYDCCVDPEYEEPYNPDLVDPYSEDTNWYIDETGNIIWKKKR